MKKTARQKIVIIGCGNVAWHIASHLHATQKFLIHVYNHQPNPLLSDFKLKLKCTIQVGLHEIIGDADYYFICVADKVIAETAARVHPRNPQALVMHNSGSAKLKELGKGIYDTGVFYPLQSFSKADQVDWKKIPIVIEGKKISAIKKLTNLAHLFSDSVVQLSSKQRLKLHLAAVLVNNFTNALYVAAEQLLENEKDLDFMLLEPLIGKTTEKLRHMTPVEAQTGPAKRNDQVVMKNHLDLLHKDPELKKIYKHLSRLIIHQQKVQKHELQAKT